MKRLGKDSVVFDYHGNIFLDMREAAIVEDHGMRTREGLFQELERRYGELWDERSDRLRFWGTAMDANEDALAMERWADDGGPPT